MFPRSRPRGEIDAVRNRRAEQELQRIAILSQLPVVLGEVGACRVDRGLGLAQRELRARAAAEHLLRQRVGLFLALQRVTGDVEQGLIGEHREVRGGDFRHQRELHTAPRFARAEVLLQGCMAQATDAAEEVQLVIREADADVIGVRGNPAGRALALTGCGSRLQWEEF